MTGTTIDKIIPILKSSPIFKNSSETNLKTVLKDYGSIITYRKNEKVFSKESNNFIGIILKGEAKVTKNDVVISHLNSGQIYGAAFLYNSAYKFQNTVTAVTPVKVLIIEKDGIDFLLSEDKNTAINYIEYLSERIVFLNSKIEGYIKPSAEEKLLLYLKQNCKQSDKCEITVSMTELSGVLGISRASLYRVMENLQNKGKINRDGKKIYLQI